jgi:sucrose-6-phosphate hydrolase SacC (GH32 family)
MVAVEAEDRRVLLHRSPDLIHWEFLSEYGPAGAVGGVWECPDLFPLPVDGDADDVRWVLLISLNPGGIAGGSGTQYVVGRFDGVRFTPDEPLPAVDPSGPEQTRAELERFDWLDYGRDCYAGVTFSDLDERVLIAWMSNWDYAKDIPTAPWRGAMSVPRRLDLVTRDGRPQLRQTPFAPEGTVVADLTDLELHGGALVPVDLPVAARIDVRAEVPEGGSVALRLRHDEEGNGGIVVTRRDDELSVDRTAASFGGAFGSVSRMALGPGGVELTLWLDAHSIEVFADRGERTISDLAFAEGTGMTALLEGGARIERLTVTDLG